MLLVFIHLIVSSAFLLTIWNLLGWWASDLFFGGGKIARVLSWKFWIPLIEWISREFKEYLVFDFFKKNYRGFYSLCLKQYEVSLTTTTPKWRSFILRRSYYKKKNTSQDLIESARHQPQLWKWKIKSLFSQLTSLLLKNLHVKGQTAAPLHPQAEEENPVIFS